MADISKLSPDDGSTILNIKDSNAVHWGDQSKGYVGKNLLKVNENSVTVYGTPWNGKERRGNNTYAPLKAIIFLNRGTSNTYRKIENNSDIYFRLMTQVYLPLDKSKREKALKIIDILLKRISFYEINVNTDISSAVMTYERIIKNEIK